VDSVGEARLSGEADASGSGRRLPRGSLDKTQIVEAALAVTVLTGVAGLTMPLVAKRLGVRTTAVQWHFSRRDDLLAALNEEAVRRFNGLLPRVAPVGWDENLAGYWREFRRIARAYPALGELVVIGWTTVARHRDALRLSYERIDEQLGVLMEAGFSPESAARAYHALSTYVRGCLLNERTWEMDGAQEAAERADGGRGLSEFPHMRAAAPYWSPTFATDEDFERGLAIIIEGLRSELAQGR
jgi:AcrR family transcriptional regulator